MKFNSRITYLATILLSLLFIAQPSVALDLNVRALVGVKNELDLNAQVGIDQATRDYINTLPMELRKQIVEAVRGSLMLLDESVKKYIDELDVMLAKQVINAQCAADGVIGNGIGQVGQRIFGRKPVPIEDIKKDRDQTIASYRFRDPPSRYYDVYVDLLTRVKTTFCIIQIEPAAQIPVRETYDDAFKRWSVWNHVKAVGCSDASACFSKIKSDLTTKVANSDARDVKVVDAINRLGAVVKPVDPGLFGKWIPTAAELSLAELIAVDNGLDTTKAIRELRAATVIEDVKAKISATQSAAGSALLRLGQVGVNAPLDRYVEIWQAVDPILAIKTDARQEIGQAIELRPDMINEYTEVKNAYEAALDAAQQQRNVAQARYDAIKNRPAPTPVQRHPDGEKGGPGARN